MALLKRNSLNDWGLPTIAGKVNYSQVNTVTIQKIVSVLIMNMK